MQYSDYIYNGILYCNKSLDGHSEHPDEHYLVKNVRLFTALGNILFT